jgi:hypothetical protein
LAAFPAFAVGTVENHVNPVKLAALQSVGPPPNEGEVGPLDDDVSCDSLAGLLAAASFFIEHKYFLSLSAKESYRRSDTPRFRDRRIYSNKRS